MNFTINLLWFNHNGLLRLLSLYFNFMYFNTSINEENISLFLLNNNSHLSSHSNTVHTNLSIESVLYIMLWSLCLSAEEGVSRRDLFFDWRKEMSLNVEAIWLRRVAFWMWCDLSLYSFLSLEIDLSKMSRYVLRRSFFGWCNVFEDDDDDILLVLLGNGLDCLIGFTWWWRGNERLEGIKFELFLFNIEEVLLLLWFGDVIVCLVLLLFICCLL